MTKKTTMLGLFFSFFLALSSGAQVSYFIHFPGSDIEGDTEDSVMKPLMAFELVNFNLGILTPVNIEALSSGGAGVGRAAFEPIEFVSRVGGSHGVQMLAKLVAGEHVDDAVITARSNTGGPGVEIFKIELKLVLFERVNIEASEGDQSILHGAIQFGAIKITTKKLNPDGSVEIGSSMEWSQVLNQASFAVE